MLDFPACVIGRQPELTAENLVSAILRISDIAMLYCIIMFCQPSIFWFELLFASF